MSITGPVTRATRPTAPGFVGCRVAEAPLRAAGFFAAGFFGAGAVVVMAILFLLVGYFAEMRASAPPTISEIC